MIYREPLSDRQMLALRARAAFTGPATGVLRQGVRDASEWLERQLVTFTACDQRPALKRALQTYALKTMNWDVSEYEDGWAAVLDDVLQILDLDADAMNHWTWAAEAKGMTNV